MCLFLYIAFILMRVLFLSFSPRIVCGFFFVLFSPHCMRVLFFVLFSLHCMRVSRHRKSGRCHVRLSVVPSCSASVREWLFVPCPFSAKVFRRLGDHLGVSFLPRLVTAGFSSILFPHCMRVSLCFAALPLRLFALLVALCCAAPLPLVALLYPVPSRRCVRAHRYIFAV